MVQSFRLMAARARMATHEPFVYGRRSKSINLNDVYVNVKPELRAGFFWTIITRAPRGFFWLQSHGSCAFGKVRATSALLFIVYTTTSGRSIKSIMPGVA